MTLAQRLKTAMEARKISQGQLSKQSGLAQSMIWKLANGKADGTTKMVQLAHALQVNTDWLQSGKGSMEAEGPAKDLEPLEYKGLFPVRIYEGEEPTEFVMMVPDLVKSDDCRAYKLNKDSGCAEAPAGTVIVVDSTEQPGQNDLVYASAGGGYSVYRYVEGGTTGFLAVDDSRVPLIEITSGVTFSGVVVYLMRDLRN